jgi:signal recognition particle subunit SRP68
MNIRIFATLEEVQSGHGIPHRDYAQYRVYCTKRLARLRRVKEVRTHLLHNHRYVEGVSGRRHAYCPRKYYQDGESKEPVVIHENLLWDIFFQAERAWAQACEMEASPQSTKSHVQRRLNKAAKWASQIPELAKSLQSDETTIREAEAYAAWMKGNACLKRENYLEAFRSYRSSRHILLQLVTELGKSAADAVVDDDADRQRLTLSDIWMTRAESVVKPLERYCHYEARDEMEPSDLIDENDISPTMGSKSAGGIFLSFRGKQIALDDYTDLAVVYLKMEESLKNINMTSHHDEDSFMQLFSDLDDAVKWAHSALHRYNSLPDGPAVTARRQDLQAIAAFFEYQKLSVWGQRQERRVTGLDSDADILHVYDTLLQNAQAMLNLLDSGDGDDMEDDAQWLEAQAHVIRIRAFRCFYLTRLYESSNSAVEVNPKDMLIFIKYTKKLAKRAEEEIAACDMEDVDYYLSDLETLQKKIEIATCRMKAAEFLERTSGGETSKQTNRPLWMRLDEMDSGSILVDSPPLPVPIPGKPVFYDIAWQYIGGDYPSEVLEAYIKEHDKEGKTEKKTRGGFFGWFG